MGDKEHKDALVLPTLHPDAPVLDPSVLVPHAAATTAANFATVLSAPSAPDALDLPEAAPTVPEVPLVTSTPVVPTSFVTDTGIPGTFRQHSTLIGSDAVATDLAARIAPLPGWHDVVLHGLNGEFTARVTRGPSLTELTLDVSAREVAESVARNPNWEGRPVRLLVCYAFHPEMVQAVSNYLGVAAIGAPARVGLPGLALGQPYQFVDPLPVPDSPSAGPTPPQREITLPPGPGGGQEWYLAQPTAGTTPLPAAQGVDRPHYLEATRAALGLGQEINTSPGVSTETAQAIVDDFNEADTLPGVPAHLVQGATEATALAGSAESRSLASRVSGALIGHGAIGPLNLIFLAQDVAAAVEGINAEGLHTALGTLPTIDPAQWVAAHPEAVAAAAAGNASGAAYVELHVVLGRDDPSEFRDTVPQPWHVVSVSPATITGQLHENSQLNEARTQLDLTISVPLNEAAVHVTSLARDGDHVARELTAADAGRLAPETSSELLARALGQPDQQIPQAVSEALRAPLQSLSDAVAHAGPQVATAAQASATSGVWAEYRVELHRGINQYAFAQDLLGPWEAVGPVGLPTFVGASEHHSERSFDATGERMVVTVTVPVNDAAANADAGLPVHPLTDSFPASVHALYTDQAGWPHQPTDSELEDYQHKADDDSDGGKGGLGLPVLIGRHAEAAEPTDTTPHDVPTQPAHHDPLAQDHEPTPGPVPVAHDASVTTGTTTGEHHQPLVTPHAEDATQQGATTVTAHAPALHVALDPSHGAPGTTAEHDVAAIATTTHQPLPTHDPSTQTPVQHQVPMAHVTVQPPVHVAAVVSVSVDHHTTQHLNDGSIYG